jgi:hypothetical protein
MKIKSMVCSWLHGRGHFADRRCGGCGQLADFFDKSADSVRRCSAARNVEAFERKLAREVRLDHNQLGNRLVKHLDDPETARRPSALIDTLITGFSPDPMNIPCSRRTPVLGTGIRARQGHRARAGTRQKEIGREAVRKSSSHTALRATNFRFGSCVTSIVMSTGDAQLYER